MYELNLGFLIQFSFFHSSVRTSSATDPSQKSGRLNSEETGCKSKDTPADGSKDSSQSGKSAESGQEADKDFIFI